MSNKRNSAGYVMKGGLLLVGGLRVLGMVLAAGLALFWALNGLRNLGVGGPTDTEVWIRRVAVYIAFGVAVALLVAAVVVRKRRMRVQTVVLGVVGGGLALVQGIALLAGLNRLREQVVQGTLYGSEESLLLEVTRGGYSLIVTGVVAFAASALTGLGRGSWFAPALLLVVVGLTLAVAPPWILVRLIQAFLVSAAMCSFLAGHALEGRARSPSGAG